ncbi:MAG: ECF transporter S component [Clostridiaceae bacterium]|nr:ECF transporter S component [Clostridiaceae bacterium]
MKNNTRKYVLTGLMTALVFVLTYIIKIPVPYTSGYIHLGDSMIYISVMVLGPAFGAFASGIGSMLADIAGGYLHYAVPTLVIKSLMALVMGLFLSERSRKTSIVPVVTAVSVWAAFCAGTLLYLNNQLGKLGVDNLVKSVLGDEADSQAIKETTSLIERLPVYFTAGIAILTLTLAITAYLVSKRSNVFTLKSIMGMNAAGICMVMGYFTVEAFMYAPVAAIFSIPPNMIQFFGGVLVASLLAPAVTKVAIYNRT